MPLPDRARTRRAFRRHTAGATACRIWPGRGPGRAGVDVYTETLNWVGDRRLFMQDGPIPLVLSPNPCVYRERAIKSLEKVKRKSRIIFTSHSYAGKIAAVKAGMGLTVLPRKMVPAGLEVIVAGDIPKLEDTHISLLKHDVHNNVVNNIEKFILNKLQH